MKVIDTSLPGVRLIEPAVHGDARGFFKETWRRSAYHEAGIPADFVQSNVSRSTRGVLRGLHYQWPGPQGKLLWVLEGAIYDVAVDLRVGSPTRGTWVAAELSADNHRQLWVPEGFGHGFQVLSDDALVCYQCTREFDAGADRAVAWNDPDIGVQWPLPPVQLSPRDAAAPRLRDIADRDLPNMEP